MQRIIHTVTSVDEEIAHANPQKPLDRFAGGMAKMTRIEGVGHNGLCQGNKYRETLQAALQ